MAEPFLEQAQDDATLIAIRDMERAGIDIITDGEMRRESYSNRFATALEGVDIDTPAMVKNRAGASTPWCRASSARCAAATPVEVRDMEFLRRNTDAQGEDHAARPVHDDAAGARTSSTRTRKSSRWTSPPR